MARRVKPPSLLQFDGRALRFELLFDLFGFLLGHAFLHRAGRAFHQVLGLFQAQVGDRSDLLDDLDLLLPSALQDDRELGLLLGRGRSRRAAGRPRRRGRRRHRRRDGHAELLLELLDQLGELDHRQVADRFDDVVVAQRLCRHCSGLLLVSEAPPPSAARLVGTASREPTLLLSKPFTVPTEPAIGARGGPPSWASSSCFVGRLARRFTSSGVTVLPSTSPSLMAGFSNSFAKSASTLAAAMGSAPVSTRPVGPARCASRPGTCASASARRASVFFTTTKSVPPPANRSRRRSWVILATSSPVKSVTYTVEALRSRVASAVTISCFSALVRIMRTPPDPRGLPVPSCSRP